MATFPILTSDGDTIVTADGFAVVVEGPAPPVSTSTLLVLSDRRDLGRTDAVTLNEDTGAITAHIATPATLPYGAAGDTVADGRFAISKQINPSSQVDAVQVYDTDYTLLEAITILSMIGSASTSPNAPVKSDGVDIWYIAINSTPSVVHSFTQAGLTGDTWTPTAHGGPIRWMAISRTGTPLTLYYTETGTKPIYRWDLTNNVVLGNFVTNSGTDFFENLACLGTGDVLCLGMTDFATNTSWCVRRYNQAGTLQQTYTLGVRADAYELPFLFLDYNDDTAFWVKAFTDATGHTARYFHIGTDGSTLADFVVNQSIVDGDGPPVPSC
jgi:hypothetical protein